VLIEVVPDGSVTEDHVNPPSVEVYMATPKRFDDVQHETGDAMTHEMVTRGLFVKSSSVHVAPPLVMMSTTELLSTMPAAQQFRVLETSKQEMALKTPPDEAWGILPLGADQVRPPLLVTNAVGSPPPPTDEVPTAQQCRLSTHETPLRGPVEPLGKTPSTQATPASVVIVESGFPEPDGPTLTQ
jgi:hypothetical protein